jgi:hypothetical protein
LPPARLSPEEGFKVLTMWRNWNRSLLFAIEAQQVMALRMLRMAPGNAAAAREAHRMVSEKAFAMVDAQLAAAGRLAAGASLAAAMASAAVPYRRRVRANHRRLTRGRG